MKLGEKTAIGLVENRGDERFECGTCQFFEAGTCYNTNPKLHKRPVEPEWCCNLYRRPGMRTIVE